MSENKTKLKQLSTLFSRYTHTGGENLEDIYIPKILEPILHTFPQTAQNERPLKICNLQNQCTNRYRPATCPVGPWLH